MLERRPKEIKIIPRSSDNRYHYLERFYDKQSIYKYMNLETALICLKLGKLRFSQISEWADEYEKRFYNADYSKLGNIKGRTPKLYACCFCVQRSIYCISAIYRKAQTCFWCVDWSNFVCTFIICVVCFVSKVCVF